MIRSKFFSLVKIAYNQIFLENNKLWDIKFSNNSNLFFRYAACIAHILTNTSADARQCIQERARDSVNRFSTQQFEIGWIRVMESLVNTTKK